MRLHSAPDTASFHPVSTRVDVPVDPAAEFPADKGFEPARPLSYSPGEARTFIQAGPLNEDDEPEPEPAIDQGTLEDLIKRERDFTKAWAQKLKSLTKVEHQLYHWYVTCGVPKNRTCREMKLATWQFEALAKSAGAKLEIPLKTIRDERRVAAAAA